MANGGDRTTVRATAAGPVLGCNPNAMCVRFYVKCWLLYVIGMGWLVFGDLASSGCRTGVCAALLRHLGMPTLRTRLSATATH